MSGRFALLRDPNHTDGWPVYGYRDHQLRGEPTIVKGQAVVAIANTVEELVPNWQSGCSIVHYTDPAPRPGDSAPLTGSEELYQRARSLDHVGYRRVEVAWRCTRCFKWSHAERRPSSHKRTIRGGFPDDHNGYEGTPALEVAWASGYKTDDVVEKSHYEGGYEETWTTGASGDPEPDEEYVRDWVIVRCGPFEPWVATRMGIDEELANGG